MDSTAKDNLVSVAVKEVVKIKNEVSQLNNPIDVAHVGPQADQDITKSKVEMTEFERYMNGNLDSERKEKVVLAYDDMSHHSSHGGPKSKGDSVTTNPLKQLKLSPQNKALEEQEQHFEVLKQ